MSYLERLREMIYTAPSGASFTLRFTDVERSQGKKAPVSEFPNQDQGAVQDLGQTTPRYNITCWIEGENYDRTADRFWTALNEKGPGELQHPRYGTIPVLPVSISQTESFVNGIGRANFTLELVRSDEISFTYPRTGSLSGALVSSAVDAGGAAIADSLANVEIEEPGALAALKDSVLGGLDAVKGAFDKITGITDDIRSTINATVQTITSEIDALISAPLNLAASLLQLYRLPADVVTDVKSKINGYSQIVDLLADAAITITEEYGELFGLIKSEDVNAAAMAAAQASASGTSVTRSDAVDAALALRAIADKQAETSEALGVTGYESYRATRQALTLALEALITTSLNLPAERVYVTPRDMTILELIYELYGVDGNPDELIDRIIEHNNLQGIHTIIIYANTEIRWYE